MYKVIWMNLLGEEREATCKLSSEKNQKAWATEFAENLEKSLGIKATIIHA